jgi:hypothetical protein
MADSFSLLDETKGLSLCLISGGAGTSAAPPLSHSALTPRALARNASVAFLGSVLPLRYWLSWDFPSLTPSAAAMRTRSACRRPRLSIALAKALREVLPDLAFHGPSPPNGRPPPSKKFNFSSQQGDGRGPKVQFQITRSSIYGKTSTTQCATLREIELLGMHTCF